MPVTVRQHLHESGGPSFEWLVPPAPAEMAACQAASSSLAWLAANATIVETVAVSGLVTPGGTFPEIPSVSAPVVKPTAGPAAAPNV